MALCFEHGSVRSRSGFKAQPMRALAGGQVHWCLNLNGCQTEKGKEILCEKGDIRLSVDLKLDLRKFMSIGPMLLAQ